jgi:RNA-directed DNA polymerase
VLWPAGHSGNDSDRTQSHNLGRLAAFGLDLHPEKTRLIEFGRFAAPRRSVKGLGKPETFDFLGFKHIRGKHQDGKFILVRQTITKWMRDKLREIKETLYRMCHLRVPEQGRWLGQVLRGYFTYHAVPTNSRRTTAFAFHVVRHWRRALMRRSQKTFVPWQRMKTLVARWIPSARVRHPGPQARFLVKHPRWEPSALPAHARICPGARGDPRPYRDGSWRFGRRPLTSV